MNIHVIGPRDRNAYPGVLTINTTSHAIDDWQRGLSPFALGPVSLYGGRHARLVENAWQFAKVYATHIDAAGAVTPEYWRWAEAGWRSSTPIRYPMEKGRTPEFLLWGEERLGYIEARKRVYFTLYRDAVRKGPAFPRLQRIAASQEVSLWDFDGYDHEDAGMTLTDVMHCENRKMGHSFVLKVMLVYGPDVTPEQVMAAEAARPDLRPTSRHREPPAQRALF